MASWLQGRHGTDLEVVVLTDRWVRLLVAGSNGGVSFHQPGERLHRRILALRDSFNMALVKAGDRNDSRTWWGSQIASRSLSGTPLPLNAALALVACDEMDRPDWHGHLVFACRSAALCEVIVAEARKRSIPARFVRDLDSEVLALKSLVRPLLKIAKFLGGAISRWFLVRIYRCEVPLARSRISLIRSWCTPGNISPAGDFHDRNFGDLPARLRAAGNDVWVTPCMLRMNVSFGEMLRRMRKSRTKFLHVERMVSLPDILVQGWWGIREGLFKFPECVFDGCDLAPLFRESVRECAATPELMTFNLLYAGLRRLSAKGSLVERFYYPMENNPFEKLPLLAMRDFHPAGKSYGFQHSAWFNHQYSMHLAPGEVASHPVPDRILCTGSRYLEILQRSGFPADRLRLAPSYRFAYTIKALPTGAAKTPGSGILVLPGFDPDHANELLWQTLCAVAQLEQPVPVYVKPHPTSDLATMRAIMKSRSDVHCSIVEGNAMDWVEKSAMVVDSGGSVAALETILRDKPLLRVVPGSSYFFDPLWEDYPIPLSFDANQLATNIQKVLSGDVDRARIRELAEVVRLGYFEPDYGEIPV